MAELSDEFFERASERVRKMTHEEVKAALQRAGVLDADGHLAASYRPASGDGTAAPPSADTAR